jgi:F-type H+-transporting ATPase subunit b
MITIDITMPIHIINMLLLIVIMNAVLYRPIRSVLIERAKKVDSLEKEIETFEKNSQLQLAAFDKKLAEARGKAKEQMEAAKSEATAASAEKLGGIKKDSDAEKATQLGQIGQQFATAQQELKGQLDGFASAMAGKILGRSLS